MVSMLRNDKHCRSARRHSGSQNGRQLWGGQRNSRRDPARGTYLASTSRGYGEGHSRGVEGQRFHVIANVSLDRGLRGGCDANRTTLGERGGTGKTAGEEERRGT